MIYILVWWLIIQFFGWLALPVAFRVFRWLPDRGYAFSKALGLLLVSYLLWLGAVTGFLHNSRGGILLAILLVAGFSAWMLFRYRAPEREKDTSLLDFLREHKAMVISVELLFTVGFILWAVLRAYASFKIDTAGGEKFMEIAFLNAILRSVHFPPLDPWLSGFSISYYYFGYVMMAVMTRLSGAPAGVAFDLYDALLFALTLVGAFGVVYNLIPAARRARTDRLSFGTGQPIRYALLGVLLVVVMGNLSGFFESVHSSGLLSDSFWKWLNVPKLMEGGVKTGTFVPSDTGWFWWWRGSRVVVDRDLLGNPTGENITEFPFFSFLLGDNHPHVLGLPFVLMAIGLALNLLRRTVQNTGQISAKDAKEGESAPPVSGALAASDPLAAKGAPWWDPIAACLDGDALLFVMTALCLGALGFLNTWDLPIYLVLITLAYGVGLYASQPAGTARRVDRTLVRRTLTLGIGLGLAGVLLYVLFYLGFSSQASGILPFIYPPTQLRQYFVMFGPFLVILTIFLAVFLVRSAKKAGPQVLAKALLSWLATALGLLGVYALMLLSLSLLDLLLHLTKNPALNSALSGLSASAALGKAVLSRLKHPWLLLWLSGLLTFAVANIIWHVRTASAPGVSASETTDDGSPLEGRMPSAPTDSPHPTSTPTDPPHPASALSRPRISPSVLFVFLLVFLGVALTFSVEFVYLRDNFGTRMNTIFKFYYQGWVMMACASAYGVWWMLNRGAKVTGPVVKYTFLALAGLMIIAGLFYPVFAYDNRVEGFKGSDGTGNRLKPDLDGTSVLAQRSPDDWAAITWLNQNISGAPVILEAPGHSYNYEGRISALTGLPAVLGWALHEDQWRGNYTEQGKREPDIATIYTSRDEQVTLDLLHKWNVSYVILGETEQRYIRDLCSIPEYVCSAATAASKFDGLLTPVFTGQTMIYAVP